MTLDLTKEEVYVLIMILDNIGGTSTSPRKFATQISKKLYKASGVTAGVDFSDKYLESPGYRRSMYFLPDTLNKFIKDVIKHEGKRIEDFRTLYPSR